MTREDAVLVDTALRALNTSERRILELGGPPAVRDAARRLLALRLASARPTRRESA